jgi:hypothetical protein
VTTSTTNAPVSRTFRGVSFTPSGDSESSRGANITTGGLTATTLKKL